MSAVQPSPNLRHFLCIKDDDAAAAATPSRTLLDIIKDDSNATEKGKDPGSWTSLKDLLRIRHPGQHCISTEPPLSSEIRADSPSPVTREEYSAEGFVRHGNVQECPTSSPGAVGRRRGSTRFGSLVPISIEPAAPTAHRHPLSPTQSPVAGERIILGDQLAIHPAGEPPRESIRRLSVVLAEERQQSVREAEAALETSPTDQPVRMSLMDLLEETDTDRSIGLEGMRNAAEDDVERCDGGGDTAGVDQKCCICMVRHKGAAFIPCGHTFCRLCSRELWVARRHCPLCNHYIAEILDIF